MRDIVIRYQDLKRWKNVGQKILVYGRRKVGKSFFIKNFTRWDEYFFVKRTGELFDVKNKKDVNYETLKEILLRNPTSTYVIDEFHRLGEDFLDFLHAYHDKLGRIVLITSTLWLSRKLLNEASPLLGIFEEFKMSLIDEKDILLFTSKYFKKNEIINAAVYLREPWIIPIFNKKLSTVDNLTRILIEEKNTIERLTGEIFREEERELKKTYLTILLAISDGKSKSSEISSFLFSRGIINKDDPSIIQSYLKTLLNIGLIKKLKVLNKKFDFFLHFSPILDLYFYLDAKYGFSELELSEKEVKEVVRLKLPLHVEDFFRILFSKIFGLSAGKIVEKDYDIDIVLTKFKRIEIIGEVKWKNIISKKEVKKINEVFSKFKCKKFVIVPDEKNIEGKLNEEIDVIDVKRILKIIKGNEKI